MPETRSLQEVIFAAHFQAHQPFTVLDLADWFASVERNFPIFQQNPPWEPVTLQPTALPQFVMMGFQLPRVAAMSEDQHLVVHLQQDRIVYTWKRMEPTGELTPYPGYDQLLPLAIEFFEEFRVWYASRFKINVAFNLGELNYMNAFPLIKVDGGVVRLSEVFSFVVPSSSRQIAHWNASWFEPIPGTLDRVHCNTGVGATLDCPAAAIFNFSGLGQIDLGGSLLGLETLYRRLHDATTLAFEAAVRREALEHKA